MYKFTLASFSFERGLPLSRGALSGGNPCPGVALSGGNPCPGVTLSGMVTWLEAMTGLTNVVKSRLRDLQGEGGIILGRELLRQS